MSHYMFVNFCLDIIVGKKLPSYCYYTDDSEVDTFYNNISKKDKITIYNHLIENKFINSTISENHFINNIRTIIESFFYK